jgi:hypothetical protein
MEITSGPIVTPSQYHDMETYFSGLSFHIYLIDFDMDGKLDFVLPNFLTNRLELLLNPGLVYWTKVQQLKEKYITISKERLQTEIGKSIDKWKEVRLVESSH